MRTLLSDEIAASQALGFNIGVKLIRGAYMNEERSIAAEEGVESPVWDTIDQTHSCYNDCMKMVLDNLDDNGMILIGSHNKESIEKAKAIIVENGIQDSKVHFGQLKGFSDQITNMLAQENYKVYKYLPYGPTETVMPYLIRRG
jgi:proline dehydrogenase